MADEVENEETPQVKGKGKKADAPPVEKKPYGQNIGDEVPHAEAVGGQYEAIGCGMYRRVG